MSDLQKVRVEMDVWDKEKQAHIPTPFNPMYYAEKLGLGLIAVLKPYVNKVNGLSDPLVAYDYDPNRQWERAGTWLHLSTIIRKGWRAIDVETGEKVTLPGTNADYF